MTIAEVVAGLIILGTAAAALLVWDRHTVRAYERRPEKVADASLEEMMHPGDDCGLATEGDGDLGVEVEPPFTTLREESIDVPAAEPLLPLERLYDAGGMVKLGRNMLHDHCLYLRREGRYGEICSDCGPSLVGSAAKLPRRRDR